MSKILFSVIVPLFNAEKYIGKAIDSVINQTYTNWELLVIDDCSTDSSAMIVQGYCTQDSRIFFHKLETNTGSAYIPRQRGAELANGQYLVILDSDDYIEETYLAKYAKRVENTNADTVLGKMYLLDKDNNLSGKTIPASDFDESQILSGKDALRETVPWKIGLNGMGLKKDLFLNTLVQHEGYSKGVYGDELFFRHCLFNSNIVVFTGAKYYYRYNTSSLVHTFSPRIFHMYDTYREVRFFLTEIFGEESQERFNAEMYMAGGINYCMQQFLQGRKTITYKQEKEYLSKFRIWYEDINWQILRPTMGIKQKLLETNGFSLYYHFKKIRYIIYKWYHFIKKS